MFLIQTTNFVPYIKDHIADLYAILEGPAKKGPFADLIEKSLQSAGIGKVGSVLPEFKQNDANGKSISLSSFRGKYVLIDFWASWCGPCKLSFPYMASLTRQYAGRDFALVTVNLDRARPQAETFLRKMGSGLPVIYDSNGAIAASSWKAPSFLAITSVNRSSRKRIGC